MEESKFDARMLLPLLLVPLLAPLVMIARFRRKRRKAKELAAAKALARRLEAERLAGKGKAKKGGKGKADKKAAAKAPEALEAVEAKKKEGFFAKRSAAYRKRLIRFIIMLGIERLIAARRAQMEEEFLNNSLLRRFSKAKDI